MMLIEQNGKLYLSSLRCNPYKENDWLASSKLYIMTGKVPIPKEYSRARIKNVEHIEIHQTVKSGHHSTACILIIQFENSIWACYTHRHRSSN